MAASLYLRLWGTPELSWGDEPISPSQQKVLAMLCYLALQPTGSTREELAELLWRSGKSNNLRQALYNARKLPHADQWLLEDDRVKLMAVSDVTRFEVALHEERYDDALHLWNGQAVLLDSITPPTPAYADWLEQERERLQHLFIRTIKQGMAQLAPHQPQASLQLAHQLLALEPLDEDAHQWILRLEHQLGRTEAALEHFESYRSLLQHELALEPSTDILSIMQAIEQGGNPSEGRARLIDSQAAVPERPAQLFGREELLHEAEIQLAQGEPLLLHGFGGMGKTALAATLVARQLEQHDQAVLWLQVGSDTPDVLFDGLARVLGCQQAYNRASEAQQSDILRQHLREQGLELCILDDVWNAYTLAKLRDMIPAEITLLVTSRQRYPKLKRLDVGRLSRSSALALLAHYAASELQHSQAADALCDLLGDHAFALRMAGIKLHIDALAPEVLLADLKQRPLALSLPENLRQEGRESIAALFDSSLEQLNDEAYEAFMAFGGLFTPSVTPELLARCLRRDLEEVEQALFDLQRRALAERVTELGSDVVAYRLHDLAYSFVKNRSHSRSQATLRACQSYLQDLGRNFDLLDSDLSNVIGAIETADSLGKEELVVEMMRTLVVGESYFLARGHTARSFTLLEQSVEKAKQLGNLETSHYLVSRLGDAYRELRGDWQAAKRAYEEAFTLASEIDDLSRQAIIKSLLGLTHFHLDAPGVATLLAEALGLARASGDDGTLGRILQNSGYIAGMNEDWQAVKQLNLEAVEVAKRIKQASPASHEADYSLFFSLLNLGEAERMLGQLDESIALRHQAMQIAQERDNELWLAYAHHELAETYQAEQDHQQAAQHSLEALKLYQANHASSDVRALEAFRQEHGYEI